MRRPHYMCLTAAPPLKMFIFKSFPVSPMPEGETPAQREHRYVAKAAAPVLHPALPQCPTSDQEHVLAEAATAAPIPAVPEPDADQATLTLQTPATPQGEAQGGVQASRGATRRWCLWLARSWTSNAPTCRQTTPSCGPRSRTRRNAACRRRCGSRRIPPHAVAGGRGSDAGGARGSDTVPRASVRNKRKQDNTGARFLALLRAQAATITLVQKQQQADQHQQIQAGQERGKGGGVPGTAKEREGARERPGRERAATAHNRGGGKEGKGMDGEKAKKGQRNGERHQRSFKK